MKWALLAAGLLSAIGSCASLDVNDLQEFESLYAVPENWNVEGTPDPKQRLIFRVAVRSENDDKYEQTFRDVSDPFSSKYGQHLTKLEMRALMAPSQSAVDGVMDWLHQSGIADKDIENKNEWINFAATIEQAEKMMNATYRKYRSSVRSNLVKIRTLQYSVPAALAEDIEMIHPTTRFAQIRPLFSQIHDKKIIGEAHSVLNVTYCNTTITPTCLRDLYNIKGYTPSSDQDVSGFIGVNGFLEQYARYSDLALFNEMYAPWAQGANFSWTSVNGGLLDQKSTNDSTEANLDIQYTVSLSYPLHNNYYSTAGRGLLVPDLDQPTQNDNQNEPYLEFFTYLLSLEDDELPHTLSTSYGEDEQSVPASYASKVCKMIGQLGARGVTILFSSGDTGVGSGCLTNDGKNTTRFLPIFPASCPYVTSVGGTYNVQPERAVGFSSGGFSDRWPQPWWQANAVDTYLGKLGDRWSGLYNPTGRGFPDIAAQGRNFRVLEKGRAINVGGTSASAPTVAAIVALLNSARVEKGDKPLGFMNPWLYQVGASALNDIVNGGSTGCTGTDIYSGLPGPFVPYASWNATEGWDPVTGLGTPDFQKLLALVKEGPGRYAPKPDYPKAQ